MTGFAVFGLVLALLLSVIIWAAVRAGSDTGAELDPAERRDAAIEALRELEFEYRTGKLSEEEYVEIRRRIEVEAITARDAAPATACPECGELRTGDASFCGGCGHAF